MDDLVAVGFQGKAAGECDDAIAIATKMVEPEQACVGLSKLCSQRTILDPEALAEIGRVLKPGGRLYAATNGLAHMRELDELLSRVGII